MFDDFVRLPLTIFITRSTNKVWKYKKEYKTIDLYTFHPKKDALPILQECPFIIIIGSGAQPPATGLAPSEPLNLPWTSSAVQIPQLRQSKTFAGLQVTRAMVMVKFLAISYLDTILQENSFKLQRLRQPPSSVPAQNNGQSQPPAERRTFITVLLAAEVFTPILYFSPLWPSLIFCLLFLLFLSLPHLKSSSITWRCPSVRGTIVCQRIAVLPPHYIHHTTIANSHHPNNCHHLCQRLCHQSHHCHCHGHPWSNAIKQQNKSEQSAHVYQTYHPIQQSFKRRRKPGQKPEWSTARLRIWRGSWLQSSQKVPRRKNGRRNVIILDQLRWWWWSWWQTQWWERTCSGHPFPPCPIAPALRPSSTSCDRKVSKIMIILRKNASTNKA